MMPIKRRKGIQSFQQDKCWLLRAKYCRLSWASMVKLHINTKVTPKKTSQDEVAHSRSHVKARPCNFPNNGDCGGLEDLAFRMLYT